MDAYLSNPADFSYSDEHPILIAASGEAALARAESVIEASGLRVGARLSVANATERLRLQGAAAAVWVEIDRDCGTAMDELLALVSNDVADGRYAAVVSTTAGLLDPLVARLETPAVELIVDADEAERIAALAIVTARRGLPHSASDIASDKNAERLRQLSDEVSRIAATLARLSTGPGAVAQTPDRIPAGDAPPLTVETVRTVIRARRLRTRYFSQELFADPAWDMLLDLLQAEIAQLRVPVSSLCIAAAVPATTALRWLKTLVAQGLFIRRADPHDGRRVFVELAPEASHALRRYFADVGQVAVI
jgi:DNA-binding MarR family transcriptional regulator